MTITKAIYLILGLLIVIGVASCIDAVRVRAGEVERQETLRDPTRGDWFRSLTVPGSKASCCDVSDCARTIAHQLDDGSWMATVRGVPNTPIPNDKILMDKTSIDGEAYVCSRPTGLILCFIRPTPGF